MTKGKLLLTSSGITNDSIQKALIDLLGKPISEASALFVPTAIYAYPEGVKTGDVLILLGLTAFFFGLAVLSFQRRNVTIEAWPWQRAKISRQQ